ncbi:neuronal acetylcholine receptor subunit alpha-6-like isoform X1 [Asterias rubens]|uniref:neuronal acetylcholine receptor subunit alpha-6-like isoform X1 n=1 Tax=Asterias rubens TaxID=7604 RepID=UPI0014551E9A|nr:neuronal acetylcholine receptor subunit alpha-6-like isoform X1 [Asterias rubens]
MAPQLQDIFVAKVLLVLMMCLSFHGRVVVSGGAPSHSDKSRLLVELLRSYDKRMYPESPVNVTYSMSLQRLERLDETTNLLYISALEVTEWSDSRLVWDPASFNGVPHIPLSPDHVWTPNVKPDLKILDDETVQIGTMSDGKVHQTKLLRLALSCTPDLANYPYDSPSCKFKVEDLGYSTEDINLYISEIRSGADLNAYEMNALWRTNSFNAVRKEIKYACCEEVYETINYSINLSRKPNGFAVRVLAPAVLTSLLVLFCFLIPPSCGERSVVCSVLLVATIIQMVSFNLSVPMVGGGTPFLGVFFCFSVFMAFFATVVSVASLNLARGFGVDAKDGGVRTVDSSKTTMLKIARFIDVMCFVVFILVFAIAGGTILNNHPTPK